jgi:hypothetical protein
LRQDDNPAGTVSKTFEHWRLPALPHHRYFVILGAGADIAYLSSTVVRARPGFPPCGR